MACHAGLSGECLRRSLALLLSAGPEVGNKIKSLWLYNVIKAYLCITGVTASETSMYLKEQEKLSVNIP